MADAILLSEAKDLGKDVVPPEQLASSTQPRIALVTRMELRSISRLDKDVRPFFEPLDDFFRAPCRLPS
jgi:hypothetical protein